MKRFEKVDDNIDSHLWLDRHNGNLFVKNEDEEFPVENVLEDDNDNSKEQPMPAPCVVGEEEVQQDEMVDNLLDLPSLDFSAKHSEDQQELEMHEVGVEVLEDPKW